MSRGAGSDRWIASRDKPGETSGPHAWGTAFGGTGTVAGGPSTAGATACGGAAPGQAFGQSYSADGFAAGIDYRVHPSVLVGVGVGLLFSLAVPDAPVSPMAAAGIAAAAAAMIKLPGTSALLGALLISGSGAAIAPFAIFGALVGLIVRTVADRRLGVAQAPEATTPSDPQGQAQPA